MKSLLKFSASYFHVQVGFFVISPLSIYRELENKKETTKNPSQNVHIAQKLKWRFQRTN